MLKYKRVEDVRYALSRFEFIAKAVTDAGVTLIEDGDTDTLLLVTSRQKDSSKDDWRLSVILPLVAKTSKEASNATLSKAYAYEVAACLMMGDTLVLDIEYSTETNAWSAYTEAGPKIPALWKDFLPILASLRDATEKKLITADQVPNLLVNMAEFFKA